MARYRAIEAEQAEQAESVYYIGRAETGQSIAVSKGAQRPSTPMAQAVQPPIN